MDAHTLAPQEYDELPDLTDDMLQRAVINKGGRPLAADPRQLVSIRLPQSVIARWKATGSGWQTRAAGVLIERAPA
ncbi:MAG: BrnA antitoxin family protein [Burkholderiaceae bacterium]|jgi:uncharacterized protein (DUF4415 family)|nr:BrnA antitoxin family protein [Burkholderiaceae bacterium]